MDYISTRDADERRTAGAAILAGLAPDGGLYVPATFPRIDLHDFEAHGNLARVARTLLQPFVAGDRLATHLDDICDQSFNFKAPLINTTNGPQVLELFHGPTAAFKDFGARFLAACFARVAAPAEQPLTILVATSGDTGGAVAAAFHRRKGVNVDVFYPAGQVSPRQEHQLTCWGDNVRTFCVQGSFDECQSLVKSAFVDNVLTTKRRFSSANSINLGRLLPQMVYYAWASLEVLRDSGRAASFIIPSGNLGNALACIWARRAGLPIERIALATNANRTVVDYLDNGDWLPRPSVATMANAMDVGNPSNMERLFNLHPAHADVRAAVSAVAVSDDEIAQQIKNDYTNRGQIWCPHTATAMFAYDHMSPEQREAHHWVAVATAHPAKFETVVEPLIGTRIQVPKNLAALLELPSKKIDLRAELDELRAHY